MSTTNLGPDEEAKGKPVRDNKQATGAGDTYMLHPGATERTQRAKEEYEAEKAKEFAQAKALDKPGLNEQIRESRSEVIVEQEEVKPKPLRGVREELDSSFKREDKEKEVNKKNKKD